MIKVKVVSDRALGNYRDEAGQILTYIDVVMAEGSQYDKGRKFTLTFIGNMAHQVFAIQKGMILYISGREDHNTFYVHSAKIESDQESLFLPAGNVVDEYI